MTMYPNLVAYAVFNCKVITTLVKFTPGEDFISALNEILDPGSLLNSTKVNAKLSALSITFGDMHE